MRHHKQEFQLQHQVLQFHAICFAGLIYQLLEVQRETKSQKWFFYNIRPLCEPSLNTICSVKVNSFSVPTKTHSFRYQVIYCSLVTFSLIDRMVGRRVIANKRGPNGSSCCTLVWLVIILSPKHK